MPKYNKGDVVFIPEYNKEHDYWGEVVVVLYIKSEDKIPTYTVETINEPHEKHTVSESMMYKSQKDYLLYQKSRLCEKLNKIEELLRELELKDVVQETGSFIQ